MEPVTDSKKEFWWNGKGNVIISDPNLRNVKEITFNDFSKTLFKFFKRNIVIKQWKIITYLKK